MAKIFVHSLPKEETVDQRRARWNGLVEEALSQLGLLAMMAVEERAPRMRRGRGAREGQAGP